MANTNDYCHLWRLPQELLDHIFDFTYPTVDSLKIKGRFSFDYHEEVQRREHDYYIPKRWTSGVEKFMVSKKFFQNAIRAWFAAQRWIAHTSDIGFHIKDLPAFREYATEVSTYCGTSYYCLLEQMPHLQTLQLKIGEMNLKQLYERHGYPWKVPIPRDAWQELDFAKQILGLQALRVFELRVSQCSYARMNTQRQQLWYANLKDCEDTIQETLTQRHAARRRSPLCQREAPLTPDERPSLCGPLIPESRVCYRCSLKHDWEELAHRECTHVESEKRKLKGDGPLKDADIPSSLYDIIKLLEANPVDVAIWIESASNRLKPQQEVNKSKLHGDRHDDQWGEFGALEDGTALQALFGAE